MNVAVDFCVRMLYDQICAYECFKNEAPGVLVEHLNEDRGPLL